MNKRTFYLGAAVIAAAMTTGAAAEAQATTLVALTGDKTLVSINAEQRRILSRVQVSGINGRLLCMDVRPLDQKLYGIAADLAVVIINPRNGSVMPKSTLTQFVPAGARVSCDFNPAADRLRIIGNDGTNLRANVDDGSVLVDTAINFPAPPAPPNPFGGTTPSVVGAAYSNNTAGVKATGLWDIDDSTDALHLQFPPNAGSLFPIGNQLGVTPRQSLGFDIQTLPNGVNVAWLINGTSLSRVGLVSGLSQTSKPIPGLGNTVRDLAVLPQ